PGPFLDQVLMILRPAGFIPSTRGPHGEHPLARGPEEVRPGQLIACPVRNRASIALPRGAHASHSPLPARVTTQVDEPAWADVALYLAASGVGTIGLADHDHVRLSNLQRQIIHTMEGLNRSKVDGAARTVSALNPEIKVETVEATVDERNAMELLDRYEVIVDGTDSFRARYLLSDAAYLLRKPLVHGSISRIA